MTAKDESVYSELGVRTIINARGTNTVLGGSRFSDKVLAAMQEANTAHVDMEDLLVKSGEKIARLVGAEAAFPTSGAFAGLVVSAAGIMTGTDRKKIMNLPNTKGMKNEFLLQKNMRYMFDRCIEVPGAKLKLIGDQHGASAQTLSESIGPKTAGVLYPVHLASNEGAIPLSSAITIAHEKDIAVLVDSAFQLYPLDHFRSLITSGADLLAFSSKYMGGPNSVGFICGKREYVEAAASNSFLAYERPGTFSVGRGYKLDRHEITGLIAVIEEWLDMDHDDRIKTMEMHLQVIAERLSDLPNVSIEEVAAAPGKPPWPQLLVHIDENKLGKTAQQIEQALIDGEPSIWINGGGTATNLHKNSLIIRAIDFAEGDDQIVAERLRRELTS